MLTPAGPLFASSQPKKRYLSDILRTLYLSASHSEPSCTFSNILKIKRLPFKVANLLSTLVINDIITVLAI